ncbi:tail fiber protein [Enterococcus faecalis]|uniref:tail fiber protein n=3 Tax=Bacteria TaxID=2 RepID=UPI0035DA13E9
MQMKFTKELPVWLAPGIKPPESLTSDGWKASQKPPADYFNWFFSRTHGALKELQDSATHIEDFNAHKSNISNPHAVTATQVGLGNVLNQKQATKSEFDAHDQDNIRHITDVERNSWNGKAEKNHTQPWSTITGIPDSTITKKGIVKLTDSVTSTDILTAATPNSVKQVNDNANAAIASASSVNDNLTSHKIDYKNPHKVTAAQVGSYSKTETDSLFINKSEAENGLLVRKSIEITDLDNAIEPGVYSIPATGVENKPLPNSGSLIVSKDQGGIRQLFQTERTIVIRQFGGIPSKWTDWKEVAFKPNVVNLTEPQRIGGTKEFADIPLVNGTEIALKEDVFFYQKTGLDEVQADYKASFREETNMFLTREGNRVDAYLRVNVVDVTKLKTAFVPIFQIPDGFKIDLSMRESFWNVPLTVTQYTYPQGNYGALYEMDAKGIRFGSDRLGNHYLHGSWHTNDPKPDAKFKYMLYVTLYKLAEGRDFVSGSYKGEIYYVAVEIDGQLGEKLKVSDGFYKYTVGTKINKVSQNAWVIGYDQSGTEVTRSKIKIL